MSIADVDLRKTKTQRVEGLGGGRSKPKGFDGLPVSFDYRDGLSGHGGVDYRNAVEKSNIGHIDSCQCLPVIANADGTGFKEVAAVEGR